MIREDLQAMLNRRPFIPFTIHVSDQAKYAITRPELVSVGLRATFIGLTRDTASDYWDEPVLVANIHISRIESIIEATPAG